jgi:hypothetical protein
MPRSSHARLVSSRIPRRSARPRLRARAHPHAQLRCPERERRAEGTGTGVACTHERSSRDAAGNSLDEHGRGRGGSDALTDGASRRDRFNIFHFTPAQIARLAGRACTWSIRMRVRALLGGRVRSARSSLLPRLRRFVHHQRSAGCAWASAEMTTIPPAARVRRANVKPVYTRARSARVRERRRRHGSYDWAMQSARGTSSNRRMRLFSTTLPLCLPLRAIKLCAALASSQILSTVGREGQRLLRSGPARTPLLHCRVSRAGHPAMLMAHTTVTLCHRTSLPAPNILQGLARRAPKLRPRRGAQPQSERRRTIIV